MAKKTAAKKPKRRLKRTVRRSMAAVLMMTAIVVAAIPVPENLAEDGSTGNGTNSQGALEYVDATKAEYEDNGGEHNIDHASGEKNCWELDVSPEANPNGGLPQGLKDALSGSNPQLKSTIKSTYRDGDALFLEWEFLYHPSTTSATLCKYNSDLNGTKVEVGELLRTYYQTVPKDQFDIYFSNPKQYNDKFNNPMDNLSATNTKFVYPTQEIIYDERAMLTDAEIAFLEEYYGDAYAKKKAEIEAVPPGEFGNITPLKASPKDLGLEDKKKFYCEHNTVLQSQGISFTLTSAYDRRLDENGNVPEGGKTVWVVQSDSKKTPLLDGYLTDENGCLAKKDGGAVLGSIGKCAFAGVTNVEEITIPHNINTIGDQAFEGSGIVSVILNNDAAIGNATFRNCTRLTTVTFGATSGAYSIGAEAFYGCSNLRSVVFPDSIQIIGYGAFAECDALETVDLSKVTGLGGDGGCVIKDFAFYNDKSLTDAGLKFTGSKITSLGKGCFALATMGGNSNLTKFTFPEKITGLKSSKIGDYVLANREKITEVTMPENYQALVPSTTFYNCIGLHNVIFPDSCGGAYFNSDLFAHVTDKTFFVRGPELYNSVYAKPRTSTWEAVTRVSGESGVPYVYTKDGVDCYEVAMKSDDGSIYRYEVDADGTLKSCVLVRGKGSVDIVIPKKVGNYDVRRIGPGCFDDDELRRSIISITIQDDSITEISDDAFSGLPKLSKVRIGNSVAKIGERAFANCPHLFDVFFSTPKAGYGSNAFHMEDTAFQTGGAELTFHGDIVKGYEPFEYAMNSGHKLQDSTVTGADSVNVCYKSLWNSDAEGTHLTVMVDNATEAPVLLDYPKLTDLTELGVMQDMELKDYCKDQEEAYYTAYDYDNQRIDSLQKTVGEVRREYAKLLDAARKGMYTVNLGGNTYDLDDNLFEDRYGPWINERFCEKDKEGYYNWVNWLETSQETGTNAVSEIDKSLYDLLFEPIVVNAANLGDETQNLGEYRKWLKPYFETNPYNFMTNYQLMLQNPSGVGLNDYQKIGNAKKFIDGTETIIVPEGITSIDVTSYANPKINPQNSINYDKYIGHGGNGPTYQRDTNDMKGTCVPGLFSGRYVDYREKDPHEKDPRGNDVVKRIELRSVTSLPDYAFDNCEQLKSVSLGEGLTSIGLLPFRGCVEMTELIGNNKFPVEKGILFEKKNDGRYKIVECLVNKGRDGTGDLGLEEKNITLNAISLLGNVDEIAKNAFEGCEFLLKADFLGADNLKEIPEGCFKDCTSLSDVILPVSVNKIKEDAFEGVTEANGKHILDVEIRGREVDIADNAFSPKNGVIIHSYLDSAAKRYADRYHPPVEFRELGAYRVKFFDYDGKQIGKTLELEKKDGEPLFAREPDEAKPLHEADHRPGYKFKGWKGYSSKNSALTLDDPIEEDNITFVAQYESNGGGALQDGKYQVDFIDGLDGKPIRSYLIDAGMCFADLGLEPPEHPYHQGYIKNQKEPFSKNWTVNTVIDNADISPIIALYEVAPTSGGSTNTSGGSTNTSGGSTNTSGGSTNTSGNSSNTSSSSSSTSSTSSSSTSSSSTTSGTSGAGQYTVFVENGSGSGTYTPGATVVIQASIPAAGMRFDKWTTESNGVTLASVSMTATTFTMPSNNVTVKANYVADTTTATASTGTGNTTDTNGNGYTRVDIEKPGISNRDLATATTNGSTDNFIVKISETDEATRAVAAALTNKYGTLDNILYYAMDISLYDSTGTTKITNTAGLSVDITIPIPDSLVAYGGNNMAGAVINGDQLESLNESFTTINGVPCIRFRATHFSPYTIYVDTGNLVEGMLDVTPKTGDPIHPKWFLSLGLACLSMILFLKRDKKVAVKA